MSILRVGLTGGIASGKSTVASLLKGYGIKVVNLDTVGRQLIDDRPDLAVRLAEICGPHLLKGGALNRRELREHLFSHPHDRIRVEKLLHPLIWAEFEKAAREAESSGKKLIVCEAALIFETGLEGQLQETVVVLAGAEHRLKRLQQRDGIDAGLASQMLTSQVDDERRRKLATHLIQNEAGQQELKAQVDSLVAGWKKRGLV